MNLIFNFKSIFLIAIFASSGVQVFCQCLNFIEIQTQADMDSFPSYYPDCTSFSGHVRINGSVVNLNGLANITSIGDHLDIRDAPNLTNLSGLENLKSVEILSLRRLENLVDLSALNNLESVESIIIEETAASQLPSFEKLVELEEYFKILDNPQLEQIHLPDNVSFNGLVEIVLNSGLKSITGFNGMKSAGPIVQGGVVIQRNNSLQKIEGFENLETSPDIKILENDNLTKIPSFPSLLNCERYFKIESNPKLIELIGFNNLISCEYLSIQKNNLEIIDGFNKLEEFTDLYINDNRELKELSSFPSLRKSSNLIIRDSKLEKISGFNNLDSVEFGLYINSNSLLTEIDGFTSLKSTKNIVVAENPLLSDCRAFCNYRLLATSDPWASFVNNAPGCNSLEEVNNSCNDTIGKVQVFDVILNTFSGDHTTDELEDVSIDIYEGEELKLSYFSDLEGLVEVDLNKLDSSKIYRVEAFLGADAVVKMEYGGVTKENLSGDGFRIEYPNRLMDSIVSYRDKLETRIIAAPLIGGATSYNYALNGYNMSAIDIPLAEFMEISSNHTDVVEAMKRMGLGLYAMNTYLDDGISFSNSMAKAFVESNFGLYKFIKEMNGLQTVVEKLSGATTKQAFKAADLAAVKFVYDWIKKFYINGKIAALENNPKSKELGKSIKQYLTAVEAAVFKGDALTETLFQEIIFTLAGKYVTEEYFIQSATQDQLNGLQISHENIDIGFPFLVNNMNTFRTQTEVANNSAIENADFYSTYSQDIGNLASFAENVGIGIILSTLGSAAPLGESLRKFGQGLKAGSLSLNGFNFLTYSYRLTSLPTELFEITSQFELNPPYQSGQYSSEFIAALLDELEQEIIPLSESLENFKSALSNNGTVPSSAEAYIEVSNLMSGGYTEKLASVISVISNMGSVAHLNGNPDDDFLEIEGKFRQLEAERFLIDLTMIAHVLNPENDTIVNELDTSLDSLQFYLGNINSLVSTFFDENASGDYPPLISISSVNYPDTFLLAPFRAKIKIKNVGPLISDEFNVLLTPNEHCSLNLLESQLESLTLASGEEKIFEVEVTPLRENNPTSIYLEFENVRGIDESIVFTFQDQVLNFDGTSHTEDLVGQKGERISYPNPTNGIIYLKDQLLGQVQDFQIFNLDGSSVKIGSIKDNSIDIKSLPSGIYIITYKGEKTILSEKVVVF